MCLKSIKNHHVLIKQFKINIRTWKSKETIKNISKLIPKNLIITSTNSKIIKIIKIFTKITIIWYKTNINAISNKFKK